MTSTERPDQRGLADPQGAIRHLVDQQLEQDYAAAWAEWADSGELEAWQGASAGGLG